MEIQQHFKQNLQKFIGGLETNFDYIPKDTISKLKTLSDGNKEAFVLLMKETNRTLKPYSQQIIRVVTSTKRLKLEDLKFLNKITLFGVLNLSQFKGENKNTKKSLVQFLHEFLMSSIVVGGNLEEELAKLGMDSSSFKENENEIMSSMQSLMGNKDLMSLASELTHDIQQQNIDPLTLLSSLMSGQKNESIDRLMKSVSDKLEDKVNKGELDTNMLQKQAESMMSLVQKTLGGANQER